MLTPKMKEAQKMRMEIADKWDAYFENGGTITPQVKKEMEADDEKLKSFCEEATREWLEEKRKKGEL